MGRHTHYGVHSGKVMKDLDLKRYVIVKQSTRRKMLSQLEQDTAFLERNNVMDYSLLMGIHFVKIAFKEEAAGSLAESEDGDDSKYGGPPGDEDDFYGGVRSSCIEGPGIYYFGLIDVMQKYSWRKQLETWWKQFVLRKDVEGISCVEPALYRRRFMKYMRSIVISDSHYYRELDLKVDRFGDEAVLIYPPRKVLRQNMRDIYQRRRSAVPSLDLGRHDYILRASTFQNEQNQESLADLTHRGSGTVGTPTALRLLEITEDTSKAIGTAQVQPEPHFSL